jgi:hypothetical protein
MDGNPVKLAFLGLLGLAVLSVLPFRWEPDAASPVPAASVEPPTLTPRGTALPPCRAQCVRS